MSPHLTQILEYIQQDQAMPAETKAAMTKSVKETDKALTILEFKLERTEKVKRTTAILLEETIEELEQKRKAIEEAKDALEKSLEELKAAQTKLVQSEKMASLGELTAGIAHEIQNPLNFVNNFAEVSRELMEEMNTEIDLGNSEEAREIAKDIMRNLEKINHHGKRADGIVKGMLQHSQTTSGKLEPADLNAIVEEYIRLCYHGLRAKDKFFSASIKSTFDPGVGNVQMIPQDIGRVVFNLLTNAFYAVNEAKKLRVDKEYEPVVTIHTERTAKNIIVTIADNGTGIPAKILDKIFQPFFTTKPTGQGTGLGLSLAYDIVTKGHGGELRVETREDAGSTFMMLLPV